MLQTHKEDNAEKMVLSFKPVNIFALIGLDIDNVVIELNGSEPPIMDGSSKYFVESLESAGIQQQDELERNL